MVPERRKTNVVSSEIVLAYCMESFQAAVQGKRTQTEHGGPPELRGGVENSGKPRCVEFVAQNTREERAACKGQSSRKNAPEISRGFASSL